MPSYTGTILCSSGRYDGCRAYLSYRTTQEGIRLAPDAATKKTRSTGTAKLKLGTSWLSPALLVWNAEKSTKCPHAFKSNWPYQDIGLAKKTPKAQISDCLGERMSMFTCGNMFPTGMHNCGLSIHAPRCAGRLSIYSLHVTSIYKSILSPDKEGKRHLHFSGIFLPPHPSHDLYWDHYGFFSLMEAWIMSFKRRQHSGKVTVWS